MGTPPQFMTRRLAGALVQCRAHSNLKGIAGGSRATFCTSAPSVDYTFYTSKSAFPAFNGWKVAILLEELKQHSDVTFDVKQLDLQQLEHKQPWFLELNPNGRIPALLDHRSGQAVWESGSIMLYLAEVNSCFLPGAGIADPRERARARSETLSWLCFQLSGIGPIQGQAHAFTRYVPHEIDYSKARFENEIWRLYSVMDTRLEGKDYVADDAYSIADMSLYPWVAYHKWAGIESLDSLTNLRNWVEMVGARPAVQRGMALDGEGKSVAELIARAEEIREVVGATTLDKGKE